MCQVNPTDLIKFVGLVVRNVLLIFAGNPTMGLWKWKSEIVNGVNLILSPHIEKIISQLQG